MTQIKIGAYTLTDSPNMIGGHAIWIDRPDGEGMSVKIEVLEKLIDDFYKENF